MIVAVDNKSEMTLFTATRSSGQALARIWLSFQVSHRGKYSIERTLSLDEYAQSTSLLRASLVTLWTPIPVLIACIVAEMIPLRNPEDGWRANYGAWLRALVLTVLLTVGIGLDARYQIPGRIISSLQIVVFALLVTTVYMPFAIMVAALWTFPIPFMLIVMSTPFAIFCVVAFRVIIGAEVLQRVRTNSPGAILKHLKLHQGQNLMLLVYPAFQALFYASVNTRYEIPLVVLVLPWLRISFKQLMARRAIGLDDLIPEIVVLSAELFNSLYVSSCIQRISSSATAVAIIALDVLQNLMALRGIHARSARVYNRHRQLHNRSWNGDLLTAVRALIVTPRRLDIQALIDIQLRSIVSHSLSGKGAKILESLEHGRSRAFAPPRTRGTRHMLPHSIAPVVPSPSQSDRLATLSIGPSASALLPATKRRSTQKSTLLLESQGVLFMIEYIVLAEYFELFSSLFYVIFMATVSQLPAAKYHAELDELTAVALSQALVNNLIFVAMKVASFVLMLLTLYHVCGHNGLSHLAFVLKTRMKHIQLRMMIWIMMVMGFRIVHYGRFCVALDTEVEILDLTVDFFSMVFEGVDFTFRFEWIK